VKIAVCLRRVPDTTTKIVIGPDGKSIVEAGVKFVPNPYDEYAVEAAIALKDAAGGGETVVIGFGGDAVQETLRTALAMGIDRAMHLQGMPVADGFANARVLAGALQDGGYDLVLFGKLAVDDYGQQTGPMVAELLGIPCATAITSLTVADGKAAVAREVEGGVELAECALPAAFTCDKGLNTPRLPSLKGIMAAKKKPMDVVPSSAEAGAVQVVSLTLPAERAEGKIVGEGAAAVPALVTLLTTEAKVL
jgi:electron transfer flavoprotein beta subunit